MTGTLIRKELRQHWLAVTLLTFGTMLGYSLIILATVTKGQAGSSFEVLRLFVMLMGPLSAVLLAHRLVVLEYQSRTQLFLEGLPLARWRMVLVKYGVGLVVILSLLALAFAAACALALRREELTTRFLGIVALKSVSVVWFTYSFCFSVGLLGRYRVAIYLAIFLIIALLAEQTQLQVTRFGPTLLLDNRFAFEGEVIPWAALRVTWELGLLFMALTAVLSLIREGTVAALLAERMSHKEKVFLAALFFGLLEAGSLLSEKTKRVPFDLTQAVAEVRPGVVVKVAGGDQNQAAHELARFTASELAGVREYLGLEKLPPVFISRRRDLDADQYERGELEGNDGVQVRVNFEAPGWDSRQFESWLLGEVLIVSSHQRAQLETKRWVLDGFPLFWTLREHAQAGLASDPPVALRSLYGAENGFSLPDLDHWLSFRERVGDGIASGVAWSGLRTLARHQGAAACQKFLRSVLSIRPPKDIRATVGLPALSWQRALVNQVGIAEGVFFTQWQEELAQARRALADQLKQLPHLQGQVTFVPLSKDSRKIRYSATIEPAPKKPVRYVFLHTALSAYDEEIDPKTIEREQQAYPEKAAEELPETYSRGARLYWTVGFQVPQLQCQVISGWKRQEVE
jgi:hypothetical protein